LPLGMLGHDPVHEVEELDAPAAAVMLGVDFAAGNVERCEQAFSISIRRAVRRTRNSARSSPLRRR